MTENKRIYVAIDLKSFYASVECNERGLDPLTTNLVVADSSRTEKTICLAVSPSLKSYGISGRGRLYEVVQKTKELNAQRLRKCKKRTFSDTSFNDEELIRNMNLELSYIVAPPRMALYIEYSTRIYDVYLKYISPDDIHVYSIDEVFIDLTSYLKTYGMTPKELTKKIIRDVLETTGITATAGIGTNLYLCKVAMDIVAKHVKPDNDGACIALLDEERYRRLLWKHKPITDFWRVGRGYAKRLENLGLYTMGDIAKCSIGGSDTAYNEDLLYKTFGINAELLIDHAWGYEPCTIKDIKTYKPQSKSITSGQVLPSPYTYSKTKLIIKEMVDLMALDLVEKNLVSDQLVLTIGYDVENLKHEDYDGEVNKDYYGRKIPKHAQGRANLQDYTSSSRLMTEGILRLYDKIVDRSLTIRRVNVSASHLIDADKMAINKANEQLDLFTDYGKLKSKKELEKKALEKEKRIQEATIKIKNKYGKNAIVKGMNLEDGAKTMERNKSIGGHKA